MKDLNALFRIRQAIWSQDDQILSGIRRIVFIEEQNVPQDLEWDGKDRESFHLLAMDNHNHPIGTARLLPSGQIGRMAVLKEWRRQGVGTAMLRHLLNHIEQQHLSTPFLHAQLSAVDFYAKQGFVGEGEVFMEAGIPHRTMKFAGKQAATEDS